MPKHSIIVAASLLASVFVAYFSHALAAGTSNAGSCAFTQFGACEYGDWSNARVYRPSDDVRDKESGGGGNCSFNQPFNETWKAKYQDILKCYMKGLDPPIGWRPGGGTGTVEGTRGAASSPTSITAWRAPEDPPIEGQSASNSMINFTSNFPSFPGYASGGGSSSGSSSSGGGGSRITCPTNQTAGLCSCPGTATVGEYSSHNCSAAPNESGDQPTTSGGGAPPANLCSCEPNTLAGTLSGSGTTTTGAGNISGNFIGNLSPTNSVSGTFSGYITYADNLRHSVTGTFSGTMAQSGTITGTLTGKAKDAQGNEINLTGTIGGTVSTTDAPQEDVGFCALEGDRDALTSQTLTCGGAIPAPATQNRINSLMDNPTSLALIDNHQYWFHYFEKNVSAKRYNRGRTHLQFSGDTKATQIPTFLCRWEDACNAEGVCERKKVKDIDIPPPLPQTFSFNRGLATLYIKLKTVRGDPLTLEEEFTTPNKVLRVPLVGGKPYVPKDDENGDGDLEECDLTVDYYVDEPPNTQFLSFLPYNEANCDRGQFFLPESCQPKILMFDKDNPSIIAPPASEITFYPVEGRNEVMVSNNQDGQLMIRYPSLFRLGGTGNYHFPDGVTAKFIGNPLLTQDNQYLWIAPPATIPANSNNFTFPNGGWIDTMEQERATEYSAGATATINWGIPLYVMPQGVIEFRGSMEYPTYRSSYIRKPVDVPENDP